MWINMNQIHILKFDDRILQSKIKTVHHCFDPPYTFHSQLLQRFNLHCFRLLACFLRCCPGAPQNRVPGRVRAPFIIIILHQVLHAFGKSGHFHGMLFEGCNCCLSWRWRRGGGDCGKRANSHKKGFKSLPGFWEENVKLLSALQELKLKIKSLLLQTQ